MKLNRATEPFGHSHIRHILSEKLKPMPVPAWGSRSHMSDKPKAEKYTDTIFTADGEEMNSFKPLPVRWGFSKASFFWKRVSS